MRKRRAQRSPGESPWYTIGDMMRLFDVTDKTIWKWTAAGKLPEPRRHGRRWTRWVKSEVDELLVKWGRAG